MAGLIRQTNPLYINPLDAARERENARRAPIEQEDYARRQTEARGEIYVPPSSTQTGQTRWGGTSGTGGHYSGGIPMPGNTGIAGGGGYGYPGAGSPAGNQVVSSTGDAGGRINLSRDAYESQQAMMLRAKLANDAFGKLSSQGGGQPGAQVQYGGANADAARAAAFARAKEQAGQNANASLKAMQDIMGRRGLRGSSIEAGAQGGILQSGGTDIANVITSQMEDELSNIQHVNDVTYQGGIAQRGQDMNARNAFLSMLAGLY